MATDDREWKVRLQFLDEAKGYLEEIERELLGLSDRELSRAGLDKVLRASHSIKGGAAMMGFTPLSQFAHRLEDFFKVLQTGKAVPVDARIEGQFLRSVDAMRQVAMRHQQRQAIDDRWLQEQSQSFDLLYEILGEPSSEDRLSLLNENEETDMRVLMFETEVDACLQRLTGPSTARFACPP